MAIETFGNVDTRAKATEDAPLYWIWGVDHNPYGPAELPELVNWIKDERVLAETWVFGSEAGRWAKASEIPELKMFFQKRRNANPAMGVRAESTGASQIKPGALRRIKILAALDDEQLEAFIRFMEIVPVRAGVHVVRKGETGEAMYLVLEGEVRSSLFVEGKETPIATLPAGSIFGEISLLDGGPHTADVISNQESIVIKISRDAFDRVTREAPQVALPFLLGLSQAIAGRVRNLTKRYEDSVHLSQTAEVVEAA